MIPEGWIETTIGEVCNFSNGHGFRPPDWSSTGWPIIRIQNLNGSQDFNYYNNEPEADWIVEPGTILFAWAGTKGVSFGPTIWNGPRGVLNQHIYRIHPKGGIDPRWLFLILKVVTQNIERHAHGFKSTLVHVHKSDIADQVIHLPPLAEQRRIAEILGAWDDAIALTGRLIDALKRRKRVLMQRLLTGRVRFPGFVHSDEVQETKYGPIPAEWDYSRIAEIAFEVSGRNSNGLALNVLSCTKYEGLVDSLVYFGRQIYSDDLSTYKLVARGQFAYATNHIEEGSIGYQDVHDTALISPMYTVFQTTDEIDDAYLYKLLKTELYRHIFEVNTHGSIDRRGALRWEDFAQIRIPRPSLEEQQAIADVFKAVDSEITLLEELLNKLADQKKGLMQRLLAGQIRVGV